MSIEDLIAANTAALNATTEAIKSLIAAAPGATANAPAAEPAKPAKVTSKKEVAKAEPEPEADTSDEDAGEETAHAKLTKDLGAWLGEFAAQDKDHPEVLARKAALKEVLGKLKVKTVKELSNDEHNTARLVKWFDKQVAAGRLAPDAVEEEEEDL